MLDSLTKMDVFLTRTKPLIKMLSAYRQYEIHSLSLQIIKVR